MASTEAAAGTARGSHEEAVLRVAGGSERLEILRAEYRRHAFTPHFHETYTLGLVDRGAVAIGYRGGRDWSASLRACR